MTTVKSRLTGGPCSRLFTAKILGRYDVVYHRCDQTGFIQTEQPYWLDEAYRQVIADLDIGLLQRNADKVDLACDLLPQICPDGQRLLDYAGGYGVFTRLMRDRGFPFCHTDAYCECLFAKGFEVDLANIDRQEIERQQSFDCVTAWEVFEHLEDPLGTFDQLLGLGKSLLFSTVLVPDPPPKSADQWWYFLPETGQHISFYTQPALQYVADRFGVSLYSDSAANHLMTHEPLGRNPFRGPGRIRRILNRLSSTLCPDAAARRASALQAGDALRQADYQRALERLADSVGRRDRARQLSQHNQTADG
ncbi:class I SAM-dependent methyltransferase [Rhodopirellula sp. JC639]|uniref:class I SAM-dependent methyltransferase n=1 Tax=Stieleria mannarensis TaxID=2755585 RepID=UPI0016040C10